MFYKTKRKTKQKISAYHNRTLLYVINRCKDSACNIIIYNQILHNTSVNVSNERIFFNTSFTYSEVQYLTALNSEKKQIVDIYFQTIFDIIIGTSTHLRHTNNRFRSGNTVKPLKTIVYCTKCVDEQRS